MKKITIEELINQGDCKTRNETKQDKAETKQNQQNHQ
jgi:hypothetical protein